MAALGRYFHNFRNGLVPQRLPYLIDVVENTCHQYDYHNGDRKNHLQQSLILFHSASVISPFVINAHTLSREGQVFLL